MENDYRWVSKEKHEFTTTFLGFRDLEPRRHTSAERIILNTILHWSMQITDDYDSFLVSAIFCAKRLTAADICGLIRPEDDITIAVKSVFSTLFMRSSYALLLVFAANV